MKPNALEKSTGRPRRLPLWRMLLAVAVAALADLLQLATGAAGWVGVDQIIDVLAMLLTTWLIGFHVLLLPTFLIELVPLVDDFPTWTACVCAVCLLRRRQAPAGRPPEG